MIIQVEDPKQKEHISKGILESLPDWFGLPDSTAQYIKQSQELPFWALMEANTPQGFIVFQATSPHTAEIYVMGVLKDLHHQGIGRKLFEAFYAYAKTSGYSFIQVKTVKEGCYQEYDQTIRFYKSLGFKEFECFPTLWDEHNPCQIFIMAVQ